jgi:hypothetical protein
LRAARFHDFLVLTTAFRIVHHAEGKGSRPGARGS